MNLENIINHIETVDPEIHGRLDSRRSAIKNFMGLTGKVALAAVPMAFGTLLKKAYGQAPTRSVFDVLNFALTLEFLEAEFYKIGLEKGAALIPSSTAMAALKNIGDHEAQHVKFLQTAIAGAGGVAVTSPKFDFSGGKGSGAGPFKDAFTNYPLFLAVAQTLEDTGVRAYKGQAGFLVGSGAVLTAALNIHSVEARHASHIRQMRSKLPGLDYVKPWISGDDTAGIGELVQANYLGEDNEIQAGIYIQNINGKDIPFIPSTESFDEPLTTEQVLALVDPFIVP